MRQQLFNPAVHVHRQPRHYIFQVRMRVVPIQFGRLNQAHHRRRPLASTQRARKQPVVPANRNWPNLVFDPVVVYRQLTVLQEPRQRFPAPQAVIDRFGRGRAFGHLVALSMRLRPDTALLAVMEVGTKSEAKLEEARARLAEAGIKFELLTLDGNSIHDDPYLASRQDE